MTKESKYNIVGFVLIGLAFGTYIKKQLKKAFKTVTMKMKQHREKENH